MEYALWGGPSYLLFTLPLLLWQACPQTSASAGRQDSSRFASIVEDDVVWYNQGELVLSFCSRNH